MTCVQPLHRELYSMHPATTFVAPFLKAVSDNTEESFRRIMSEPSPGVFTFEMFQPQFCELLLSEVYCHCILLICHSRFGLAYHCSFLFISFMFLWLPRWRILKNGLMKPNLESCGQIQ